MAKAYQFLTLPDKTDNVSLDVLNNNFKVIADRTVNNENSLGSLSSSVSTIAENLTSTDVAVSALSNVFGNITALRVMQDKYVEFSNGYINVAHDAGVKFTGCVVTQTYATSPLFFIYDSDNSTDRYITIKALNIDGSPYSGGMRICAIAFAANDASSMLLSED